MKTIKFKHSNVVFAEDQPQYETMHALRLDSHEGEVISCWKMTFKERLTFLFTGKIYLSLMMFGKPLTPSYMSPIRSNIYSVNGK